MKIIMRTWVSVMAVGCLTALTIGAFAEGNYLNDYTHNILTKQAITGLVLSEKIYNNIQDTKCVPSEIQGEQVSIWGAKFPLYHGAELVDSPSDDVVRYQAQASKQELDNFYSENLAKECWIEENRTGNIITYKNSGRRLILKFANDPARLGTQITYAYIPAYIMGVRIP